MTKDRPRLLSMLQGDASLDDLDSSWASSAADRVADAGLEVGLGLELAQAVLQKLNRGVVIFDSVGRVWFANAAAEHFAAHGDGLLVQDGLLTLADPTARAAYEAYLKRSTEHAERGQRVSPIVLRVPSKKTTGPYRVLVSPLELGAYGSGTASRRPRWHVLMQYAPDGRRHLPKRLLVELYGLTSAEADLVALLLQGATPEGAAGALGVSMNTVKSQLQHVFVKCEVHSKCELMQLLMSGPRTL